MTYDNTGRRAQATVGTAYDTTLLSLVTLVRENSGCSKTQETYLLHLWLSATANSLANFHSMISGTSSAPVPCNLILNLFPVDGEKGDIRPSEYL